MRVRPLVLVATLMLIAGAGVMSCSKSSSPTSPMGGGGGANTPFDSGSLTAPATFSRTFPTAGTVGYHCNFHQSLGMVGTVMVSASATDSIVNVTAAGTSFTPATVTIKPGGMVHWNVTQGTHTVTSN